MFIIASNVFVTLIL